MKRLYFISLFALLLFMGCEQEENELLPRLNITLTPVDVSVYGGNDGSVTVSLDGGKAPFQYFWNNGSTSETLTGVPAGTYTLKVVYGNSGVATSSVVINEPDATPLNIAFDVSDVSYFGGNDGAVIANVSGGTEPYTFEWAHDNEATSPNLSGLFSGTYTLTVTDANSKPVVSMAEVMIGQPEFLCGRDSITDIDGYKYPTVQIGEQCWTATNLRTEHQPNAPEELIDGRFCGGTNCFNDNGAHYTWAAAMNGAASVNGEDIVQGICPDGWHLPTRDMWKALNSYLSVSGNGGSGSNVPSKMRGADSPSGFDALYVGNFGYDVFTGDLAVFWSATVNENDENRAWYRLVNNFPLLGEGHVESNNGLSVRCIKD